jgi:CBS domain-containing protein
MNQLVNDSAAGFREGIICSLRAQGFGIGDGAILRLSELSKERIRELHETAVEHRVERARDGLFRVEKDLLRHIASGHEVYPSRMSPPLLEVLPESEEELLFRYAALHWSIPVSSGYGRRQRFLVVEDSNGKLVGLIGLRDPVYSLGPRDDSVGWTPANRKKRLGHVMDAFVLGAVPPYSFLLCGKLLAMLAASGTVCHAFRQKYGGTRSLIRRKPHDGGLALITTASALARSSIYKRLRFQDRLMYQSVGFTKGSGEFHFSHGLYRAITRFAEMHCGPTAKQERWGTGFRCTCEVARRVLRNFGVSPILMNHSIWHELLVMSLAKNTHTAAA